MWASDTILAIFETISSSSKTPNVLMLSDDDGLIRDTRALSKGVRVFYNGAVVHAKQGQDGCIREASVGCDETVSEAYIAQSAVLDLLLAASGTGFIGSFKSSFSRTAFSLWYARNMMRQG